MHSTLISALVGGVMIGLAIAVHLVVQSRPASISGALEQALRPTRAGAGGAYAFLIGVLAGGLATAAFAPKLLQPVMISGRPLLLIAAGLLVGIGTRLAGDSTVTHAICGLAQGSKRSITATIVVVLAAIATVFIRRHLL